GDKQRGMRRILSELPQTSLKLILNLSKYCRLQVVKNYVPALLSVVVVITVACGSARAQDTAAEEAANRQRALTQLPADAAKRMFGIEATPVPGPARVIGGYTKGCLAGAQQIPADGPNWQVMRPSRNRAWGYPVLIDFLERLAVALPAAAGWPGLLIGDMAQPR